MADMRKALCLEAYDQDLRRRYLENCAAEFDQRGRNEVTRKAASEVASAIRSLLAEPKKNASELDGRVLEEALIRISKASDYGAHPCVVDCKHFGCLASRALALARTKK